MAQRIFDIENEKDYTDLWDILSEEVFRVVKQDYSLSLKYYGYNNNVISITDIIQINWHDKVEITRPLKEATEADIGKLCYFWSGKDFAFGVLREVGDSSSPDRYLMDNSINGIWFIHCRRLTIQEAKDLC